MFYTNRVHSETYVEAKVEELKYCDVLNFSPVVYVLYTILMVILYYDDIVAASDA